MKCIKLNWKGIAAAAALLMLGAGPAAAPPPEWPKIIHFCYQPVQGLTGASDVYRQLGVYLAQALKVDVQMVPKQSYLEVVEELRNKKVEAANLGPNAYVEAADLKLVEPAVMELQANGERGYYSVIIVRSDSGLRRLEDGRGKILAFTDPQSTSGFLVPMLHFVQDLGLPPASFASRVIFAGSHGAVVKGVMENKFALGATNDIDLARAIGELHYRPKDFRVLWTSSMIPGTPYCVRKDLPESFKAAFRQALVDLKDPKILAALKISGFSPTTDAEYQLIRDLRKLHQWR